MVTGDDVLIGMMHLSYDTMALKTAKDKICSFLVLHRIFAFKFVILTEFKKHSIVTL